MDGTLIVIYQIHSYNILPTYKIDNIIYPFISYQELIFFLIHSKKILLEIFH